jgi:hypothetical protein
MLETSEICSNKYGKYYKQGEICFKLGSSRNTTPARLKSVTCVIQVEFFWVVKPCRVVFVCCVVL